MNRFEIANLIYAAKNRHSRISEHLRQEAARGDVEHQDHVEVRGNSKLVRDACDIASTQAITVGQANSNAVAATLASMQNEDGRRAVQSVVNTVANVALGALPQPDHNRDPKAARAIALLGRPDDQQARLLAVFAEYAFRGATAAATVSPAPDYLAGVSPLSL